MTVYRVQTSLKMTSGLPEDAVTNTWHVSQSTGTPDGDAWRDAWAGFMDDIKAFFPSTVAQNGHGIKVYDLADIEPRTPVYESTWNLTAAPAADPLPAEVALCLSFRGPYVSGFAKARRRGRIYLGPFDTLTNESGRPDDSMIDFTLASFVTFLAELEAATGSPVFVVWSEADAAAYQPVEAWMDNAWDIQRRRGLAPTVRTAVDIGV